MMVENKPFQIRKLALAGLEQEQYFVPALELALPPVVRLNAWNKVRTGSGLRLDDDFGEASCGLEIWGGYEDDGKSACSFHGWRGRSPVAAGKEKFSV